MSNNGVGVRDTLIRRLAEVEERDRLHRRVVPIVDCIRKMRAEGLADNEIAGLIRHAADELDAAAKDDEVSPPLKFKLSNYGFRNSSGSLAIFAAIRALCRYNSVGRHNSAFVAMGGIMGWGTGEGAQMFARIDAPKFCSLRRPVF